MVQVRGSGRVRRQPYSFSRDNLVARLFAPADEQAQPDPFYRRPQMQDPFNAPQGDNEPRVVAGARGLIGSILGPIADLFQGDWTGTNAYSPINPNNAVRQDLRQTFRGALDTPAAARSRQQRLVRATPRPAEVMGAPQVAAAPAQAGPASAVFARMIGAESGGRQFDRNGQPLTSPAGAIGIAQVMPGTAPEAARMAGVPFDERRYRTDPAYNRQLGEAYFNNMLQRFGGNTAQAVAAYNAGPGRVEQAVSRGGANWQQYLPGETRQYLSTVLGGGGPGGGGGAMPQFMNPFDPSYGNAALGQVNAAEQAMLQPTNMTFDRPAAPDMPAPTPLPRTDFSRADAALEQMRPQEITEQEQLRTQRRGWLQGLGQALASLPEGAGLGRVLAAVGGGALAGRAAADQEIEQRMERFEQRMAQYNAAVYNHENGRAQVLGREAQAEVQQMNQYAFNRWQVAHQGWQRDNQISVTENAIVSQRAGANGQIQITRTPIAGAVRGAMALQRAQIYSQMGGQLNAGNGMVASATNNYIAATAAQALMGQQEGGEEAMLAAPAFMAAQAVRYGRLSSLFTEPELAEINANVRGRLTRLGLTPPETNSNMPGYSADAVRRYQERSEELMVETITRLAVSDPQGQFQRRLFEAGGGGAMIEANERYRSRRERRSVDARGRQTRSTTYSGSDE